VQTVRLTSIPLEVVGSAAFASRMMSDVTVAREGSTKSADIRLASAIAAGGAAVHSDKWRFPHKTVSNRNSIAALRSAALRIRELISRAARLMYHGVIQTPGGGEP
jgi:hypothetical protein